MFRTILILVFFGATTSFVSAQSKCATTIECAQLALDAAQATQQIVEQLSLEGAVVAFALESCPQGWDEFKPAYGRFVRGIDMNVDEADRRKVGSLQDDQFREHTHEFNVRPLGDNYVGGGKSPGWRPKEFNPARLPQNDLMIKPQGGKETRPVNVALLYCKKL